MNVFNRFKKSAADNNVNEKLGPVFHDPKLTPPPNYTPPTQQPLTAEQEEKVNKLKSYIESIMLPETHEYYPNERGFVTEATIKRYMRARKWDFEQAKIMLENSVRWRRDYRPDQLDPDYIKPEAETGKMYYNGFDKCGRPVWIMRPRLQNSKDAERQVKHIVYCLERGIRLMPELVENLAIIVDFKDSSASHNPSVSTCKKFLDILGNHYPERLGIAFVVKSPWFFFATFKVISPFMDPVTKNKIKFVYDGQEGKKEKSIGNDWVHLKDYIEPDQLESDFGGEYNFEYDLESYWNALLEKTGKPYKIIDYN
ncbi:CRAL-TRIO domain-containing protein [Mycotypha africana]|uniref:CRAL-TRIO domain-containing protein n=1 Tax=Mycotypha africana TaxID=64632 RepID=UPI002300F8A1|nr:CRAL-TRIO domain-containing protein [Mycotypha africana]KAI8979179.1 CRAL-TRIO domain-containing protein [Mycotypha africana]